MPVSIAQPSDHLRLDLRLPAASSLNIHSSQLIEFKRIILRSGTDSYPVEAE